MILLFTKNHYLPHLQKTITFHMHAKASCNVSAEGIQAQAFETVDNPQKMY